MIIPIIGAVLTFLVVFGVFYLMHKKNKPKHWSDGYVMIGRDHVEPPQTEPEPKQEGNSMFPPGW